MNAQVISALSLQVSTLVQASQHDNGAIGSCSLQVSTLVQASQHDSGTIGSCSLQTSLIEHGSSDPHGSIASASLALSGHAICGTVTEMPPPLPKRGRVRSF